MSARMHRAARDCRGGLPCRKPRPACCRAAREHALRSTSAIWMIGDILDDVEAGHRAGCRTVLLDVGHETEWRRSPLRELDLVAGNLLEAAQMILATRGPVFEGSRPGVGEPA